MDFFSLNPGATARVLSGSHFTPEGLANCMAREALDGILQPLASNGDVDGILALTVLEPCIGVANLLIPVIRLMATAACPDPTRVQEMKRRILSSCIYGVEKNEAVVPLAKAALWKECAESGVALPSLDHRLRVGDSLVGTWFLETPEPPRLPRWLSPGFGPLNVFKENKALLTEFPEAARRYEALRIQWRTFCPPEPEVCALIETISRLLRAARINYQTIRGMADLATAIWFWPVEEAVTYPSPQTYWHIMTYLAGINATPPSAEAQLTMATARRVGRDKLFFHWELEFPELFLDGNKPDICLSNPPWGGTSVNERAFLRQYNPLA